MLKDIFIKEEKTEEEKSKELKQKTLAYLVILIIGTSFLFFNTNENKDIKKDLKDENTVTITKEDISKKIDNIKNNYSLEVTENTNENIIKLDIDTDGTLTSYVSDSIDKGGYILYKEKYFIPGSNNNFKIVNNILNPIPKNIYDLEFFKSIINYCEFTDNNTCKIKYSDYLKEYNYKYKTTYEIEEDNDLLITFSYSNDYINKISYDYTLLNKIINKSNDNKEYTIKISNIGKQDFSSQIIYFDKLIKKNN